MHSIETVLLKEIERREIELLALKKVLDAAAPQVQAEVQRKKTGNHFPKSNATRIKMILAAHPNGITTKELKEKLGTTDHIVYSTLHNLKKKGLIKHNVKKHIYQAA